MGQAASKKQKKGDFPLTQGVIHKICSIAIKLHRETQWTPSVSAIQFSDYPAIAFYLEKPSRVDNQRMPGSIPDSE